MVVCRLPTQQFTLMATWRNILQCMGVRMITGVDACMKWAVFDEGGDNLAAGGKLADGSIVALNVVDIMGVDWWCNLVSGRILRYMSR